MTDNSFVGPMSMVKIDGAKIKLLREQQGLTQLYLATAVEVTTDTISRWENRRYPSIKRDNALKLAETLNVQLDDILELATPEEQPAENADSDTPSQTSNQHCVPPRSSKRRTLLILSGLLLGGSLAIACYLILSHSSGPIIAQRIVPDHCINGQPFPVLIKVSGAPHTSTALIIKETLPDNASIQATSPKVSTGGLKNKQIKWIKKIEDTAVFAYNIRVTGKEGESVGFSGTAAISNDSDAPIIGENTVVISQYHWADTNEDNVISDDEILAVYDQYSEITDIDLDIDLIEEIWLGSEYRWDASTSVFKIIE